MQFLRSDRDRRQFRWFFPTAVQKNEKAFGCRLDSPGWKHSPRESDWNIYLYENSEKLVLQLFAGRQSRITRIVLFRCCHSLVASAGTTLCKVSARSYIFSVVRVLRVLYLIYVVLVHSNVVIIKCSRGVLVPDCS